ncbi:MAG: 5'-methylthioadenosine/S-adenosylhomocysteine nucleosidase [Chloroflexales bacterium]|nr:5'-methylthioadenosine/S-adenosylhomocysteine nucleosidase [Chloroflexales bacterium]
MAYLPAAVIVLVCADIEWEIVRRLFADSVLQQSCCGEWFTTDIVGEGAAQEVVFFHTGWGKTAAASSVQYVIDHWAPSLLINIGTCGGLEGRVEPGTLILAQRTLMYDIHAQIGSNLQALEMYTTAIDLAWVAEDLLPDAKRALIVSADRDIAASDVHWLTVQFDASVGDWESAAIAFVARRNDTACLIFRGVTDLVGTQGGEAYNGDFQFFADNASQVLITIVRLLPRLIYRWRIQSVDRRRDVR